MKIHKVLGKWMEKLPKASLSKEDAEGVRMESNVLSNPELVVEQFRKISQNNVDAAVSLMEHRYMWAKKDLGHDVEVDGGLERIILDPSSEHLEGVVDNPNEIYDVGERISEKMNDKTDAIEEYTKDMELKKKDEERSIEIFRRKYEESIKGKFQNFHFMNDILDGDLFRSKIRTSDIKCVLVLSDTFYTRDMPIYKKVIEMFKDKRNGIRYVEFTNIQPNLDRKLIFRMHEFAHDHDVNAIVVIGSMSTVDLAKILLPKIMKPNIIRLHKTRELDLAIASNYYIFSIPTCVVPDPKVNARSAVKNNLFLPDKCLSGHVMYLKNEIDDSDAVFYCTEIFDSMGVDKIMQALHETFFRLVFSYFDLSAGDQMLAEIIKNIKEILRIMEVVSLTEQFEKGDRYEFLKIVSFTMDGRLMVDAGDFWLWYRLEGALSLMVNSKRSDGLALFITSFFQVMAERNAEFNHRALRFGSDMYGAYSIEGCIYRLSMHIKKYGLPVSLMDIEQVRRVDYKFLSSLLKRARVGNYFNSLYKLVINSIPTV